MLATHPERREVDVYTHFAVARGIVASCLENVLQEGSNKKKIHAMMPASMCSMRSMRWSLVKNPLLAAVRQPQRILSVEAHTMLCCGGYERTTVGHGHGHWFMTSLCHTALKTSKQFRTHCQR